MEERLSQVICEAIRGNCLCNHKKYCTQVNNLATRLSQDRKIIVLPYSVGDTVYYISGIRSRLAKPARVDEIYYNGCDFGLGLVSENNVYFDMPADKVYATEEDCLKHINGEN